MAITARLTPDYALFLKSYAQTHFGFWQVGGVDAYLAEEKYFLPTFIIQRHVIRVSENLAGEKRFALVFIACSFSRKRVTSIGYILGGKVDKSLDLKIRGR